MSRPGRDQLVRLIAGEAMTLQIWLDGDPCCPVPRGAGAHVSDVVSDAHFARLRAYVDGLPGSEVTTDAGIALGVSAWVHAMTPSEIGHAAENLSLSCPCGPAPH